ncbi:hypothetical protein ACLKA6_006268 [Drosophila palustris]
MQRVRGISSSRVTVAIGTYQLDRRNQKTQKTRSTLPRAIVGELLCPLQVTAWNRPVKQNMPSRVLVLCFIFFFWAVCYVVETTTSSISSLGAILLRLGLVPWGNAG